jgi:hypothetical protein
VEQSLSFQAKREVLQRMAPQYRQASPSQKRTLLESCIATTGYVRTCARWLLNHAEEVQQTHGRSHLRRSGPDVQHTLFLVWNAANRICANPERSSGDISGSCIASPQDAITPCKSAPTSRGMRKIRADPARTPLRSNGKQK